VRLGPCGDPDRGRRVQACQCRTPGPRRGPRRRPGRRQRDGGSAMSRRTASVRRVRRRGGHRIPAGPSR
jgi:hypothetical protein